jgi:hypothetical protein
MTDEKTLGSLLKEIADVMGGRIDSAGRLPDGSGFATMSYPLPKNHWLYEPCGEPTAPMRVGSSFLREVLADKVREAARYAIRASTMSGKENDFDPDAMVQNFVVGMLGYWTVDGCSHMEDEPFNQVCSSPLPEHR